MKKNQKYLLDTSIQIKRLTCLRWRKANHDQIWQSIIPLTSNYSFMEFKNSIIAAICYLIQVIEELKTLNSNKGNLVSIRIYDIIKYLNASTNIYEGDRRVKFANYYAAKLQEEYNEYPLPLTYDKVLLQLKSLAINLQEIGFYYYTKNGIPTRMKVEDHVDCHLGKRMSPIEVGNDNYSCKKDTVCCKITQHISNGSCHNLILAIETNQIKIKDKRLSNGVKKIKTLIEAGKLKDNSNIGQRLCQPIGDCILVSKASKAKCGIFTVDKDQIRLANHLNLSSLLFSSKMNIIIET
jgi:hypothetical protein